MKSAESIYKSTHCPVNIGPQNGGFWKFKGYVLIVIIGIPKMHIIGRNDV